MKQFKRRLLTKEISNLRCKENGRSSDFITPSFILGCAGSCQFCYVHRNNRDVVVAENAEAILEAIRKQFRTFPDKVSNQCDDKFWLLDIGCNTDVALHYKHLDWVKVFDFFKHHKKLKASFATKWVNQDLINYCPENKVRMRYSMLPQNVSDILCPKMSTNEEKILAANKAVENKWEIHWNFSPVVVKDNWLREYKELFQHINDVGSDKLKSQIACEVIFLTHEEGLHNINTVLGKDETLLWNPSIQENKVSLYGGHNVRYRYDLKAKWIKEFTQLLNKEINYCPIRYIF